MIATTILNGILGFAALVAILFCVGDIEAAEKTPSSKFFTLRLDPREVPQPWSA